MASRRIRLSWNQKRAILDECNRQGIFAGAPGVERICQWAFNNLKLSRKPCHKTVMRIIRNKDEIIEQSLSVKHNGKENPQVLGENASRMGLVYVGQENMLNGKLDQRKSS